MIESLITEHYIDEIANVFCPCYWNTRSSLIKYKKLNLLMHIYEISDACLFIVGISQLKLIKYSILNLLMYEIPHIF